MFTVLPAPGGQRQELGQDEADAASGITEGSARSCGFKERGLLYLVIVYTRGAQGPARSWSCSLNLFQEAVVTGIKWEYTRGKKGIE